MKIPKALIELHGVPLLSHHISALSPFSREIRIVTGAHATEIRHLIAPHTEIHNAHWQSTDMRQSIRLGLEGLASEQRVWLTPIDCPPPSETVLQAFQQTNELLCAGHQGNPGHPISASAAQLRNFLQLGPLHLQQRLPYSLMKIY